MSILYIIIYLKINTVAANSDQDIKTFPAYKILYATNHNYNLFLLPQIRLSS